ncbi:hypothetical protein VE23_08055 [Paenibacillus sp. D9]|nr:hypothetical protein VE23_08055 [Paenibacillus sp. D9]
MEYEPYFYFVPGAASLSEESNICLANEPGGANLAVIPVEAGAMRFRLQEGKVSKVVWSHRQGGEAKGSGGEKTGNNLAAKRKAGESQPVSPLFWR